MMLGPFRALRSFWTDLRPIPRRPLYASLTTSSCFRRAIRELAGLRDNHIGPEMKDWSRFNVFETRIVDALSGADIASVATVSTSPPRPRSVFCEGAAH